MQLLTVLLRIALSVVFGIAGVTKLLDPRGTRDAVKNFGSPDSLAPALSIALPIAELAVAVGLLFTDTVLVSSLGALVLLVAFVLAIGVNLARGHTHDCHCFGQLYSRPLGWPTFVRNAVFALGAGFVLWQAATDTLIHPIPNRLAQSVLPVWWPLFAALAVLITLWIYLRKRRKPSPAEATAPRGLPIDSAAPPFELTAYAGGTRSLAELIDYGKPVLLIFTNPTCGPCVVLFAEIKEWQQAHSDHLTIALISFGTIKENFVNVARNGLGQVLLQQQREVAEKYGANVTPTAVLVNTNGRIASAVAAGADEIRALLATVVGTPHGSSHHHHAAKSLSEPPA